MNMILAEAAGKATTWPDVALYGILAVVGAFVFWCIAKY